MDQRVVQAPVFVGALVQGANCKSRGCVRRGKHVVHQVMVEEEKQPDVDVKKVRC